MKDDSELGTAEDFLDKHEYSMRLRWDMTRPRPWYKTVLEKILMRLGIL